MTLIPRPFATWTTYKGHTGVDYPYATGTPIRAGRAGRISFSAKFNDRSGYMKEIDHGGGIKERFYHLRDLAGPGYGENVSEGDTIAYVGNTGTITTGPHLHHEVWVNGRNQPPMAYWSYVDAYRYVGDGGSSGGGSTPFPPTTQGAEMYIIRAADRQPALVGPGYVRYLDAEEAANIGAITSKDTTINARQYDLAVSAATTGRATFPFGGGGVLIKSPNRGYAYVAPGIFRDLSEEERTNGAAIFGQFQTLNDRQYDLARSMATTGQVPAVEADVDIDYDLLAEKIAGLMPGADEAAIATAVRAEFTMNPLK